LVVCLVVSLELLPGLFDLATICVGVYRKIIRENLFRLNTLTIEFIYYVNTIYEHKEHKATTDRPPGHCHCMLDCVVFDS